MSSRRGFRIRLQRGNQRLTLQGWARDLSESGLGAFVAEVLVVGEFVTLEIPLEDSERTSGPSESCSRIGNRVRISVHGIER
jgi:hypothetical protein